MSDPFCRQRAIRGPVVEPLERRSLLSAAIYYVSPKGNDANPGLSVALAWRHVQKAFDAAPAGSTVDVLAGRYREATTLNVSGSAAAGYTTFQAVGHAILDGAGDGNQPVISIADASYVKISGFDIVNYHTAEGGAAVLFEGTGDHVHLLNNRVHHTSGFEATAIGIYGTGSTQPITNLVVDGNQIYDCRPADSETLTLNGNVTHFSVTNNSVHDTNNIGIDFIGGEGTSVNPGTGQPDPATDEARDGICQGNIVYRSRASYGGGYGAGIYVDGAQNIVVEQNTVSRSNLGIEVGCEHAGRVATGIIVRDNLLYNNDKSGLAFGGYQAGVGRVQDCQFLNNTLYHNQTKHDGNGELWIQLASNNIVENNLVYAGSQDIPLSGDLGSADNTIDYNLYFATKKPAAARFRLDGNDYQSLASFSAAIGRDLHSIFANPLLTNPAKADIHLQADSPAINAGDPAFQTGSDETDFYESDRLQGGRVDIGAVEANGT